MRWFIEVSNVGAGDTDTQYCVEAKQWQAALQQARKLRGEGGPLSAFSIELLDNGYRAVDKKQNLKYVVKKAPADAPLNDGKNGATNPVAEGQSATLPSADKPESGPEPDAATQARPSSSPRTSGPPPRPRLESARPLGKAEQAPTEKRPVAGAKSVATPKTQQVAELLAAAAMKSGKKPGDIPVPAASQAQRPPVAAASGNVPAVVESVGGSSAQAAVSELPEFEVIRTRDEEPSKETPITYREVALGVKPGVARRQVEALLWARYRSTAREIEGRPKGKFVQLAVFDHVFSKKPIRPPLATLMWKDWRGEPILSFPGFMNSDVAPAPELPAKDAETGSLRPVSVIPVGESTGSIPPPPKVPDMGPGDASSSKKVETLDGEKTSVTEEAGGRRQGDSPEAQASSSEARQVVASPASTEGARPGESKSSESAARGSAGAGAEQSGAGVATEQAAPATKQSEAPPRKPNSDDLIGDLFEKMHNLHFMADMVAGSEFVLSVIKSTLPSKFALVHVFDINSKNFVVVRQHGTSEKAVLFRTPDEDTQLRKVMRSPRSTNFRGVANEVGFTEGRWKAAGVVPDFVLCGPVRQGGRYLGLIELGNPAGARAFAEVEANALDYICEQFAEFLANRPIVLDADVILK